MVTFTWGKATEAFVWGEWWDFSGFSSSFDPDGTTTSTRVELYNSVDDVRIIITGTGFSPTGSEVQPTSGTITGFQVIEQGNTAVTLTGMSMTIATFGFYVLTEDVDGFLNAVLAGHDYLNGNGRGDTIYGRTGGDTIRGLGGNDALYGEGGNDVLRGDAGNDKLYGAGGNDTFIGGVGIDTLTGGVGRDTFVLNVGGSVNRDVIKDFNVADDTIKLEDGVFTQLGAVGTLAGSAFHIGAAAHDADDRIIYNATTGFLFYDANGDGAGAGIQIATLSKNLALTAEDFVVF